VDIVVVAVVVVVAVAVGVTWRRRVVKSARAFVVAATVDN